jgi:hypothetical protein
MGFWSEADYGNCNATPPPTADEVAEVANLYSSSLLRYNYTADEISDCTNLDQRMKQWGEVIQGEGLKNLIVMVPTSRLDTDSPAKSAVDIWVVLPNQYLSQREAVDRAIARGQQVWMYSALFQTNGFAPAWQIDFSPLNFRATGFLSAQTDLTGMLYWTTDWGISKGKTDWQNSLYYITEEGERFPGDGNFFYSGAPAGLNQFVESLRLKWLRDTVEDYEYFKILSSCGLESTAKQIISEVASDWDKWSDDSMAFRRVRQKLANLIEERGCSFPSGNTTKLSRRELARTARRLGVSSQKLRRQTATRLFRTASDLESPQTLTNLQLLKPTL